jgi:hypothetical protein
MADNDIPTSAKKSTLLNTVLGMSLFFGAGTSVRGQPFATDGGDGFRTREPSAVSGPPPKQPQRFSGAPGGATDDPAVVATGGAADPNVPAAAQAPAPVQAKTYVPDPAAVAQAQEEDRIRGILLDRARQDFAATAQRSADGYSKDLKRRGDQLSKQRKRELGSKDAGVVYIDPNKFFTGVALGLQQDQAVKLLVQARKYSIDNETASMVAKGMTMEYPFRYGGSPGDTTITQNPAAYVDNSEKTVQACAIVPPSAYHPDEFRIPGLPEKKSMDFMNGHEGEHCLDTVNTFAGINMEEGGKFNTNHPELSIDNEEQLKVVAVLNRKESLSDVGKAGKMIRDGADPSVIANVTKFRTDEPDDLTHMTAASLQGLSDAIGKMGVRKFRALSADDAEALYKSVVDATALTPETANYVIAGRFGNDDTRAAVQRLPQTFQELREVIDAGLKIRDGADPAAAPAAAAPGADGYQNPTAVLQEQVRAMGVERFRNLDDADAAALVQALDDKTAMSREMAQAAVVVMRGTPQDRADALKEIGETEKNMRTAADFSRPYSAPLTDEQKLLKAEAGKIVTPLTPAERSVADRLDNWDATKLLEDRAMAKDGKITPTTLAKAYGAMENDLRRQIDKNPDDPYYRAQGTKLMDAFVELVKSADYVAENAKYGVDIYRKENLSRFAAPTSPDPGTAASSPGAQATAPSPKKPQPSPPGPG